MDILRLFPSIKRKLDELQKENLDLKSKLGQKQDQINKVNAFWKKKLYQKR
jgi:predicted nuclease with TOPRIM domain